jgi:arginine-tRNA-protein transferase
MTFHGHSNSLDLQRIKDELETYFVESSIDCPYGLPNKAVYHQALFDTLPDFLMDIYLAAGYRRNGNIIYNMHCNDCTACVPIRVIPEEFRPNRNQKRVLKTNHDMEVEVSPLQCSDGNLALLQKFLDSRYPGRKSSAIDYYSGFFLNHICNTIEFRYFAEGSQIGVAIVDLSDLWLNVVFFYFDPKAGKRSPGTFNILYLIDFCLQKKIKFVYLGYCINEINAMRYKAYFKPHYIFKKDAWHLIQK